MCSPVFFSGLTSAEALPLGEGFSVSALLTPGGAWLHGAQPVCCEVLVAALASALRCQ